MLPRDGGTEEPRRGSFVISLGRVAWRSQSQSRLREWGKNFAKTWPDQPAKRGLTEIRGVLYRRWRPRDKGQGRCAVYTGNRYAVVAARAASSRARRRSISFTHQIETSYSRISGIISVKGLMKSGGVRIAATMVIPSIA